MFLRLRRWARVALISALALIGVLTAPASALNAHKRLGQCRLDVWGAREGLPGYDIIALAQTPDGYIWVGTTAGLFRFDGKTFERFDRSTVQGLASNLIRSLLVTRDGQLWVGTEWGGFGRLMGNRFERVDSERHWNATFSLHEAADGAILAGYACQTGNVLNVYRHGALTSIPMKSGMFSTAFVDLPNGATVTSVLYDRLRAYKNGKLTDYPLATPLANTDLRCMIRRPDGVISVGTDSGGMFDIESGRWKQLTTANGLSSNAVNCLYEDNAHRLLVGTNAGLDILTSSGIEHIQPADGLGGYNVGAMLEDREGNLWVATGQRLNRFADTALTPVSVRDGMQPKFNMAAPMADGGVLCATSEGLFEQPAQPYLRARRLFAQGMEGVQQLPNGDIYSWNFHPSPVMGYDVQRYHGGACKVVGHVDFFPIAILGNKESPAMLGLNGELQTLGSVTPRRLLSTYGNPQIFDLARDSTGTTWLGTEAGLFRVDIRWTAIPSRRIDVNRTEAVFQNVGVPAGAHVLSIDARNPNCLWLGTDQGLVRVRDGHGTVYGTSAGLPDDDLLQVLTDDLGKVWAGGYFGIFCVSTSDVDAYDRHAARSIPASLYATADGLRAYPSLKMPVRTSIPIGPGPPRSAAADLLWFIGDHGLTVVDPHDLAANPARPPMAILSANVDGLPVLVGRTNAMQPGRGEFTVNFAALSFIAPEKVRFRCRLLGYDPRWVDIGTQRSKSYTNLPPGAYTFEVTGCNNDGAWASAPASVRFALRPHIYQTLPFRIACLALFAGLLFAAMRLRIRSAYRYARTLEQKVAERTAELATANADVTESHDRLQERNAELQEIQMELEAHNQELLSTQQTLAEANEKLHALATTDGLTGLINHRTFQERLQFEWNRHRRENAPLSLILVDVDNFKSYNDTYGHPAGDEVLRMVARILRTTARDTDIAGRYGGEEFVVIAPNTDSAGAAHLAERLRAALESGEWPLRPVTSSLGVSTVNPAAADPESVLACTVIANADAALYRSKHAGKNRVTSTETPLRQMV